MKDLGIPTEEEFVSLYSELTGTPGLTHKWNFYMAFTFFRVAAILQGVYKRSLQRKATLRERKKETGRLGRGGREGERDKLKKSLKHACYDICSCLTFTFLFHRSVKC